MEATGAEEERVHVLLQACDSMFGGRRRGERNDSLDSE